MSLFKLSTPERRLASEKANQILPIIPNEIYLCILELIAPATDCLTPEQCKTCAHLSGVCRFFANFCLPRVFEFIEFSGPLFDDALTPQHCHDAVYETTRETVLCTQIAAKQPLALALAKRVMTCHFTNFRRYRWSQELDDTDKLLYHAGMSHMRNIRELAFFQCFVDAGQWDAIAALPSLEALGFRACRFPRHFEGIGPGERVKVKPSRFWLVRSKHRRPLGAIDVQCLRALAADHFAYFTILDLNPQSLEALALLIDDEFSSGLDLLRRTLDELVWKNLPVLQSLTLRIHAPNLIEVRQLSSLGVSYDSLTLCIHLHYKTTGSHWKSHSLKFNVSFKTN
ncbi:hypothetical protein HD554DRAFT_1470050 [Boletus coccyginus]|nr:hypothetical protein HD554DRAFT_1470050 [Boletus coccyginus]